VESLEKGATFAQRYRIVRLIAAGGMGAVYEVVHLETERRRALKVMHPHVLASEDLRERFKREARITGRVESDHIVDVFDAGVDTATGMPFLVMELLAGEDLGVRLGRLGRLPPAEVAAHVFETALALDKTHKARIIHRDLKPRNLFLAEREEGPARIKVLDFGIAKMVADGSCSATQIVGTPLYMAPEQLDPAAKLGPAADIYALGMVAYTLLVGAPYFEEEARACGGLALASVIARGPREPARARASARRVALPEAFDAWFARATAVRPEDRFATALEAASALAAALGERAITTGSTSSRHSTGSPRPVARFTPRPLRARAIALGSVLVGALGLVVGLGRALGVGLVHPACKPAEAACGGRCVDTSADPENCGACGHGCLGGACESGACQPIVLAEGQDQPVDIVTDGASVYWINSGSGEHDGAVMRVSLAGGPATVLASGQSKPSGMAVDRGHVYWVDYGDGSVRRVRTSGGDPELLVDGQRGPRGVAAGALGIYWTNGDGGTVSFLGAAGEVKELARGRDHPGAIALDADNVYWADRAGRRVMAVSIRGGPPRPVASGPETPIGIAIDDKRVYWIEYDAGRVMSMPIRGGLASEVASVHGHPLAIAVDATRVYWTNQDDGTVMAKSLAGGDPTRLCSGQAWPSSLAVDAKSIYWTNTKSGQVMRLAK
jgi:tRNA A-37 threonylcarbamoyl transferase component Bud32/sugar lactone lactonase YvrE